MLKDANLPDHFWGEALQTYSILHNICPTKAVPNTTPFERFHQRKPTVSHLRVFGCKAFVHILKTQRRHLQPHSRHCIFLGYELGMKAWRFYDPTTKKVIASRDAIFIEDNTDSLTSSPVPVHQHTPKERLSSVSYTEDDDTRTPVSAPPAVSEPRKPFGNSDSDSDGEDDDDDASSNNSLHHPPAHRAPSPQRAPRRSRRIAGRGSTTSESSSSPVHSSAESSEDELYFDGNQEANTATADTEPASYHAAMKLDDAELWHAAALEE